MSLNPNNNVTAYIDYFRLKAVQHKDLKHDPSSETGDSDIGAKRFTQVRVEEVLTGLRTKISFPALLIELYQTETSSEIVYDVRQTPKGAFMVLDHVNQNDYLDEERAYAVTESIVYEMLQEIWKDHYGPLVNRCATPFKDWSLNYEIMPVGPLFDFEFGWRVEFSFRFHNTINLAQGPPAGTFLMTEHL